MVDSHLGGHIVAGKLLPMLENAEGVESDMREGLQVLFALVYRDDLEVGTVKASLTQLPDTLFDVNRPSDFSPRGVRIT